MSTAPPILVIRVEFEQVPVSVIVAASEADEQRLLSWLTNPAARSRIVRAVEDALDGLAQRRAA